MCSTPRPKAKVKGKAGTSDGLLSNMSAETRSRFAQRANAAQERREQIAIKAQQNSRQLNSSIRTSKKADNQIAKKSQNSLSSWLISASLKEVFMMLFFGKSKRI